MDFGRFGKAENLLKPFIRSVADILPKLKITVNNYS